MEGPPSVHVALLRGINVGGKNRLAMRELSEVFTSIGCTSVESYIQSGNVIFRTTQRLAAEVPKRVAERLAEHFGLRVPVVTRTASQLRAAVKANPFVKAGVDLATLHVAFLGDRPSREQVASLEPQRSPPDEFVVYGREVYLRFPNGSARTRLTNSHLDAKLATVSTVRNWRTVLKLLELATVGGRTEGKRRG